MAITKVSGARGTATEKTSDQNLALTPSGTLSAGNYGLLFVVIDNTSATTGQTTVISVADGTPNVWTRVREQTQANAAALDGVSCAVFMAPLGTQLTTGSTITISLTANATAKGAGLAEYSVAAGKTLQVVGHNGANGAGTTYSVTVSGLNNVAHEYIGMSAAEDEVDTAVTLDASYAEIGFGSIGSGAASTPQTNVRARVGTLSETSTTNTFDITGLTTDDRATILIALSEVGTTITHSIDSLVKITSSKTQSVDTIISQTATKSSLIDTLLLLRFQKSNSVDALINKTINLSQTIDSIVKKSMEIFTSQDSLIKKENQLTQQIDSLINQQNQTSQQQDSLISQSMQKTHSIESLVQKIFNITQSYDASLMKTIELTYGLEAILTTGAEIITEVDSLLKKQQIVDFGLDIIVSDQQEINNLIDAIILNTFSINSFIDSLTQASLNVNHSIDIYIRPTILYQVESLISVTSFSTNEVDVLIALPIVSHQVDCLIIYRVWEIDTVATIASSHIDAGVSNEIV